MTYVCCSVYTVAHVRRTGVYYDECLLYDTGMPYTCTASIMSYMYYSVNMVLMHCETGDKNRLTLVSSWLNLSVVASSFYEVKVSLLPR